MLSIQKRIENLPLLKLRASSGGELAAALSKLTDIQVKELTDLLAKPSPTALQMEKIHSLTYKRDNPQLSEGAKTFTEKWLWENMRGIRSEINTKQIAKGLIVEDESIETAARALKWDFAMKNEKREENEFFTGTPDLKIKVDKLDKIVDIKSSWDENSFKLFDPAYNRSYMFQLQIYMHLTGIRDASLVYVLSNTPLHLIKKEVVNYCYTFGYEIPKEIEESEMYAIFLEKMTYDDLPDSMRVKEFNFHYDGYIIETLEQGVKAARVYQKELIKKNFGLEYNWLGKK